MSDAPETIPPPVKRRFVDPYHTFGSVTDKISEIVLTKHVGRGWMLGLGLSFTLMMLLLYSVGMLFAYGIGVWGNNQPVGWAFDIINFVWWIGIGHAGTLISAVLLLLKQPWRTSINRFAEAMTLFAVSCAGLYPLMHLGRPWYFFFLFPYPATTDMWPQFRSPLIWDFFAVSTYATVSLLFWYIGLIPDLATLRDRSTRRIPQVVYGILAMGWRNSAKHWKRYEQTYLLLAALATPLVLSVHTIVSFDFAVGIVPGWHATIFPPYFVAGAIYCGFAMVIVLSIPLRAVYKLHDLVTDMHMDNMAKVMLASGLVVGYGYAIEMFMGWYSGNIFERAMAVNRLMGAFAWSYWALILFNILIPQLLWFRAARYNMTVLFIVAICVNIGMWLERYVIIVTSLSRDFLPSSWHNFTPTLIDWSTFVGTLGLFFSLLFIFIRVLPMISIFEMRELLEHEGGDEH